MATQKLFFSSPLFAVVGASKDKSKYGTKVLNWYLDHEKPVTPVHPKEDVLEGLRTLKSLKDLPSPSTTSVSIVTPPKVTMTLLKQVQELKIPSAWLQPGAEDNEVLEYIKSQPDLADKVVFGGPCVLVSGEGILKSLL